VRMNHLELAVIWFSLARRCGAAGVVLLFSVEVGCAAGCMMGTKK
jgi:hypothetical protein